MSPVNRKLFPDDLKKYISNADREERIITTIVEVSNNLGAIRNLKELLDRVISLIMEFTGAERCGIFLSEHKDMTLVASRNLNQSVIQSEGFEPNLGAVKKVINSSRSIVHGMESMNKENHYGLEGSILTILPE